LESAQTAIMQLRSIGFGNGPSEKLVNRADVISAIGKLKSELAAQREASVAPPYFTGEPDQVKNWERIETPQEASVAEQPTPQRELLRRLVDETWNEATESSAVPSTEWADRIIERALKSGAGR